MTVPASAGGELVHWLDDAQDSPALGGKARLLVRLASAGLPVPVGFVLSADALPAAPPVRPERSAPEETCLPAAAAAALAAAYARLGRRTGEDAPLVAVRSSGLAEDLAEASFAGQYVTVLGVRGEQQVLAAATRCWASLWSPGAAAYRTAVERRLGRALPPPGMAVIVQMLVQADAAGVAETVDPASGSPDVVVVSAAWGLGRVVADGTVQPDVWRVAREALTVLELRVGDKRSRAGVGLEPRSEHVPDSLRRRPCLTLEQAAEVAALALTAELIVGAAADVEWALAAGRLWLLQARPLAGLAAARNDGEREVGRPALSVPSGPTPGFPFVWPNPEARALHWRQDAGDARVFEPLQPFELDARAANTRSEARAQWVTGAPTSSQCLEVNGYLYYSDAPADGGEADRARRAEDHLRPVRALHERGETLFAAAMLPEVRAGVQRLAAVAPDALTPSDLAGHFEDALGWYEHAWALHCMMDKWDELSPIGRCSSLYREVTGDENRWAVYAPFGHAPQREHDAIAGLIELTRLVRQSPALLALFSSREASQVPAALPTADGGDAFCRELDSFLAVYGLQCGASQGIMRSQVMPGWREEPALAIAIVQRYLPLDLDALAAAHRRSGEQYHRDVVSLREKVAGAGATPEQCARFDFWFQATERLVAAALDHNHYLDSPINALLHRALLACGRRLAAAGAIEVASDVWWLRAHQVSAAVRGLDAPERPDWRHLVASRKALHAWQRSLTPPAYIGAPPPERPAAKPRADPEEHLPPNLLLRGQGAFPAVATGRVRLIDYRALVPDVRPGDVFVARDCGVLWASLLPVVAAVVLDASNPHEHAMRVCREFGIPGVVQTKSATTVLREGQRVTVDGARGWILDA